MEEENGATPSPSYYGQINPLPVPFEWEHDACMHFARVLIIGHHLFQIHGWIWVFFSNAEGPPAGGLQDARGKVRRLFSCEEMLGSEDVGVDARGRG